MGLASLLLGAENPFSQWVGQNQNLLGAVGGGLGQGQNIQSGLSAGMAQIPQAKALDYQAAQQRAADQKVEAQTNATKVWLQKNHPDLAQMVDAGMPISEAWQEAMTRMQPKQAAAPIKMGAGDTLLDPTTYQPLYQAPAASQGPNSNELFDNVSGLRKEVQQLPSYKNLAQAAPIYQAMAATAGNDTRASDLNLVYGLGKIMDPGSVVREGEMFMVQGINTLPDKLVEGINSLLTGTSALSPQARQEILQEAYSRMHAYEQQFSQDRTMYEGIADRNHFNKADVIPQFQDVQPWRPPVQRKTVGGKSYVQDENGDWYEE